MRYVLAIPVKLLRRDIKNGVNAHSITPYDVHPLDGVLHVLIQNQGDWIFIGNDLSEDVDDPSNASGLVVSGTWDECYPIFKFACALKGVNLP